MKIIYSALFVSLLFISCKDTELEPQESSVVADATTIPTQATQQPAVTNTAMTQNPQTNAVGMNPAHGAPGHRCDIAVGAPLSNAPATPAATTTQTTMPNASQTMQVTPQMMQNAAPAKTKTAPGMNPPHGEAGHKCEIAVGAPLNSAPAKVASTNGNSSPVTMTPAVVNSNGTITPGSNTVITTTNNNTPAMLKAPTKTAPGMNPPHGEAGHKCEVAVGAPLPK